MSERKSTRSQEKAETYGKKLAKRTVFISHIATATSCTMILDAMINSYGAKDELRPFWDKLIGIALPAKSFWNMYINKFFL